MLAKALGAVPLFSGLTDEQLEYVAKHLKRQSYAERDVIVRRDSPGDALFILTSVMSHAKADKAIVDAGLKAQSVDSGLPVVFGRTDVKYIKCSGHLLRSQSWEAQPPSGTAAKRKPRPLRRSPGQIPQRHAERQ